MFETKCQPSTEQSSKGQTQGVHTHWRWEGTHPAQWELPLPQWSCECPGWWPGRRRHLRAAPSHQRSSGSHSPGLGCWRHQWTYGLLERRAEMGYMAVHQNNLPTLGCLRSNGLDWSIKDKKCRGNHSWLFRGVHFAFTLLFINYLIIQIVGPHHCLSGLYLGIHHLS